MDTVVLGCTHFEFLSPLIRKVTGPDVTIISTHEAVSRETGRRLGAENLAASVETLGSETFFSSRLNGETEFLFSTLWGTPVKVSLF